MKNNEFYEVNINRKSEIKIYIRFGTNSFEKSKDMNL